MIGAHALTNRADITYRQLDHWTRAGYLHPIPRDGWAASGRPRDYPDTEIPIACLMGALVKAGLPPKTARRVAEELDAHKSARLGGFVITPTQLRETP